MIMGVPPAGVGWESECDVPTTVGTRSNVAGSRGTVALCSMRTWPLRRSSDYRVAPALAVRLVGLTLATGRGPGLRRDAARGRGGVRRRASARRGGRGRRRCRRARLVARDPRPGRAPRRARLPGALRARRRRRRGAVGRRRRRSSGTRSPAATAWCCGCATVGPPRSRSRSSPGRIGPSPRTCTAGWNARAEALIRFVAGRRAPSNLSPLLGATRRRRLARFMAPAC